MINTTEKRSTPRVCPACGAEIGDNCTFCNKCGAALPGQDEKSKEVFEETFDNAESMRNEAFHAEPVINEPEEKTCPVCKTSVKGAFQFCNKCGADLSKPHMEESRKDPESKTKRIYDYSLPASQPSSRFCPACKLALQPGATVCPRCGRTIPPSRQRTQKAAHFRTLGIVAYCLAGFSFFIGFINLMSVLLSRYSLFGNTSSASLLAGMTSCLFMVMTSLILTVLGSTFLFLFHTKGK